MILAEQIQIPDVSDTSDFRTCFAAFKPTPRVRSLDWCLENIVTEQARPYDHAQYPQLGAPGGPWDAFDDQAVRTISLQWGVRLGKSFFGQCACLKTADVDPAPMMMVSASEKLAKEIVKRSYNMIRRSLRLSRLLVKKPSHQKQDLIEFIGCQQFVGWARSASTLADKNVKIGHGAEVDKWVPNSTSTEGHPFDLFCDRFNDYHLVRKIIAEGSPTLKGRSTIERLRLLGTNCTMHVPCPHCKGYQVLEFGTRDSRFGIKFEAGPDGRSDPDVAKRTGHYLCRHCQQPIDSTWRTWMMRRGVWCPEGCTVIDEIALDITEGRRSYEWRSWAAAEWIDGQPLRDGEDASYHLSSLYALAIPDWGDIAKRFVKAVKARNLKAFINQWLAQTFEIAERKTTWQQLGEKIILPDVPWGQVPAGYGLITAGIDKQKDHYAYVIDAWNDRRDSHTLAYGTVSALPELLKIMQAEYPTADGGSLRIAMALLDCGFRPAEVYRLVRRWRRKQVPILPCRGSSFPIDTFYSKRRLGPKTSAPGQVIVFVDTNSTQDWIEQRLQILQPGDEGGISLCAGSLGERQDYLEQLLNDAPVASLDDRNHLHESWDRIDVEIPNDYRDAKRYSFTAQLLKTRGGKIARRQVPGGQSPPAKPAAGGDLPRLTLFPVSPLGRSPRNANQRRKI